MIYLIGVLRCRACSVRYRAVWPLGAAVFHLACPACAEEEAEQDGVAYQKALNHDQQAALGSRQLVLGPCSDGQVGDA